METNNTQSSLLSSTFGNDLHLAFDCFHTGETPKTASDTTEFFPHESNEVLNTPTGNDFRGIPTGCRMFFPEDSGKKTNIAHNGPTLHTTETLIDTRRIKVEAPIEPVVPITSVVTAAVNQQTTTPPQTNLVTPGVTLADVKCEFFTSTISSIATTTTSSDPTPVTSRMVEPLSFSNKPTDLQTQANNLFQSTTSQLFQLCPTDSSNQLNLRSPIPNSPLMFTHLFSDVHHTLQSPGGHCDYTSLLSSHAAAAVSSSGELSTASFMSPPLIFTINGSNGTGLLSPTVDGITNLETPRGFGLTPFLNSPLFFCQSPGGKSRPLYTQFQSQDSTTPLFSQFHPAFFPPNAFDVSSQPTHSTIEYSNARSNGRYVEQ